METVQLQSVAKIIQGGKSGLSGLDFVRFGFPAYGAGGLNGHLPEHEFESEAVVLSSIGARCGKCFYVQGKWASLANTQLIFPKDGKVDARFLWYQLDDEKRWHRSGSGQPFIKPSDVKEHSILLPTWDEQKRITGILDKADRLRNQRLFAQTLSDSFLQSVFIKMFGDELNEDYPKTDLIKLVTISGGGTPSREIDEYFTGRIPWLTSKDMRGDYIFDTEEHITEEAIKKSATKLVPKDSILIVVKSKVLMHRLPLAVAQVPMCHGQDIKSIQCTTAVNPLFLVYVLKYNAPYLLRIARGANTEGLTLPMLETIQVPNAPLPLQEKFAAIVQKFERIRRQQREATRQAEHLFQTLLHRAFSGNL